jgi:hypothetical protein
MTAPVSYIPFCHICNKPVALDLAKADDAGRTVHEGCYLLKITPRARPHRNLHNAPLGHSAIPIAREMASAIQTAPLPRKAFNREARKERPQRSQRKQERHRKRRCCQDHQNLNFVDTDGFILIFVLQSMYWCGLREDRVAGFRRLASRRGICGCRISGPVPSSRVRGVREF